MVYLMKRMIHKISTFAELTLPSFIEKYNCSLLKIIYTPKQVSQIKKYNENENGNSIVIQIKNKILCISLFLNLIFQALDR